MKPAKTSNSKKPADTMTSIDSLEVLRIEEVADNLAEWVKKPDPDSFCAFIEWEKEFNRLSGSRAFGQALLGVRKHNQQYADELSKQTIPTIIFALGTVAKEYKNRDDLFAHIAGTTDVTGIEKIAQLMLTDLWSEINDLSQKISTAKQNALDAESMLRKALNELKAEQPAEPKPTEGSGGGNGGQTQEQQLAVRIIKDLNEWVSVGASDCELVKHPPDEPNPVPLCRYCEKLPDEFRPNHCLGYRFSLHNKLGIDPILLKLKQQSKGDLAQEIEQRRDELNDEVNAYNENLDPTCPMHLPNSGLSCRAGRLVKALEYALPCLGAQPAKGTGTNAEQKLTKGNGGKGETKPEPAQQEPTALETYQAAAHEIANKVDQLLVDTTVRARFRDQDARLCEMVEHYGQALQPYVKKLREAEIRWKQSKSQLSLFEFCPPPAGWVEIMYPYRDKQFIKGGSSVTHRPKEPVNPLLWFGIFGNASLQRKPEDNEKLMCAYVLLAIIHDYELRYSGTPIDSYIFSDDYKGKWFERDNFCEDVWKYYHYYNQYADLIHHPATANEKLPQLNRTLEHVEHDLASTQKRPTTAEYLSGLLKHLEYLQAALQSKDQSLQLECYRRIEKYISPKEQFVDMLRQCQSEYRCHNEHTHNAIEIVASGIRDGSFPYPALWMGLADARFISELKHWIEEAKSQPAELKPTAASSGTTDDTPVTLREFMQVYCEPLNDRLLDSRVESLQRLARRKSEGIKLDHTGQWKRGQSKKYLPSYLTENWPAYRKRLPTLPNLERSSLSSK